MPRKARVAPPGHPLHVLNRSAGRIQLFRTDADFAAFERGRPFGAEPWVSNIVDRLGLRTEKADGKGVTTGFYGWQHVAISAYRSSSGRTP
jgi:hypothetical protein